MIMSFVKRDPDFNYTSGIRAHPFMDWKKCLWSLLVPWHNEFLSIYLYLGFAIYFWVQLFFIGLRNKHYYKYDREKDFNLMFIPTFGIASSLTMTCVYLIFYSVSQRVRDILDSYDYIGKLVMVFSFMFAFIGSELIDSNLYFALLFSSVVVLFVNLVFLQYKIGRQFTFWLSLGAVIVFFLYDFAIHSTPKQKRVFFMPMFTEGIVFLCAYLLYIFQIPERFCPDTKFV